MSKTAIIIPCYNEFERLKPPVFLFFLKAHLQYSIFFVDDGSSDKTLSMLNSMKNENAGCIHVIVNEKNIGKAESVRKAMLEAFNTGTYEYVAFMDADLSTPLDEMNKLVINSITENKKAVFGSRLKRMGADIDRTPLRHIVGRFFATLIAWTTGLPFYDTQCGAKVFQRAVVSEICKEPFMTRWLFDVEIIIRLKKLLGEEIYKTVSEYPLSIWKEVKGSKLNWKDLYRIPFDLLRIRLYYRSQ